MRLATFRKWNVERAALVTKSGLLPLTALGLRAGFEPEGEILPLIEKEQLEPLTEWYNAGGKAEAEALAEKEAIPYNEVVYGPLYRNPQRTSASASTTRTTRAISAKRRRRYSPAASTSRHRA